MLIEYNGRLVDSDNFRVVLHHVSGISRVAEGWDDYQRLLETKEWFEHIKDIPKPEVEKPKRKRKYPKKAVNDADCT